MKRPLHDASASVPKRARGSSAQHALKTRQDGAIFAYTCPQNPKLVDDLLKRSLCGLLHATGFEDVDKTALNGLQSLVSVYMEHFALRVKHCMQSSRRTRPQPADFSYALAQTGYTATDLQQDMAVRSDDQIYQPSLEPPMVTVHQSVPLDEFGSDIQGTAARVAQRWIPRHFPNLPGKHSYKESDVLTRRESDARRVRELATKEGMQAEQALRRLMIARQDGSKTKKFLAQRNLQTDAEAQSNELFKSAMEAMSAADVTSQMQSVPANGAMDPSADGSSSIMPTDVDFGAVVNHEKAYWRKWAVVD